MFLASSSASSQALAQAPIDRQALIARHRIVLRAPDVRAPLSVGNGSIVFTADVTKEENVSRLQSEVQEQLGRVQILINNAGINIRKNLVEFTLDEWHAVQDANLTSVFLMCRAFVPQMQGSGYGRIINMTSIMSHISLPGRSAYSSSKAALLGLTRALALELASCL